MFNLGVRLFSKPLHNCTVVPWELWFVKLSFANFLHNFAKENFHPFFNVFIKHVGFPGFPSRSPWPLCPANRGEQMQTLAGDASVWHNTQVENNPLARLSAVKALIKDMCVSFIFHKTKKKICSPENFHFLTCRQRWDRLLGRLLYTWRGFHSLSTY